MKSKFSFVLYTGFLIAFAFFVYISKPYFFKHLRKNQEIKSDIELYRIQKGVTPEVTSKDLNTIIVEEIQEKQFAIPDVQETNQTLDGVISGIMDNHRNVTNDFEQFVAITQSFETYADAQDLLTKISVIKEISDLHLTMNILDSNDLFFIEIGFFPSAQDVSTFCNQLKIHDVSCITVRKQ